MLLETVRELCHLGARLTLERIGYVLMKKLKTYWIKQRKRQCALSMRSPLKKANAIGLLSKFELPALDKLEGKINRYREKFFFINGREIHLGRDCRNRWDVDPVTQKQWPLCSPFEKIDYRACGDLRYVWELGRLQHLMCYVQAYQLTKNAVYLADLKKELTAFFEQNSFEIGIQWRDGLQIAIRLINFILIQDACLNSDVALDKIIASLIRAHWNTLRSQLSPRSVINNNHVIGELCALIITALYHRSLDPKSKYMSRYLKRLQIELTIQVYADGVPYEGSVPYIAFILEFLVWLIHIMQAVRYPVPHWLQDKTQKITEVLAQLTDRRGRVPPLGDGDDGRVVRLDDSPYLDVTSRLHFANRVLALPEGQLPPAVSHVIFPVAKLYHYRFGLLDIWLDAGPSGLGQGGGGGHGHNDTTAIIVHYDGMGVLHDPGWYSYFVSLTERNRYRASSAHNLLTVNDEEQARLGSAFYIYPDIQKTVLRVRENRAGDIFIYCTHDGYRRLPGSPVLSRLLLIRKTPEGVLLTVLDKVFSAEKWRVQWHLGSDCQWRQNNNTHYQTQIREAQFQLSLPDTAFETAVFEKPFSRITGQLETGMGWRCDLAERKPYFHRACWSLMLSERLGPSHVESHSA